MAKHPNFRPFIGSYWTESLSDDSLILNELETLKITHHLRRSKKDLTIYGNNKRMVLKHLKGKAILVWEKQRLIGKQLGIRCVLFVNNSQVPSEALLMDAMKLARLRWIEYPFFVQLFPKFHLTNTKSVFLKCGWKRDASVIKDAPVYTSSFGIQK
jgi:hypothetical protein